MMPGIMGGSGLLGGKSPFSGGGESIKEVSKYGKAERVRVENEVERLQKQAEERAKRAQSERSVDSSGDSSGDLKNDSDPDIDNQSNTIPRPVGVE